MSPPEKHSRRDFLQGKAAVRVAAAKAQNWVDSASELLGANRQPGPVAHVQVSRRAMACEFAVEYHQSDSEMQEDVLAALDLIEQIEDQLTIYRDHSQVIEINQTAAEQPVEVDGQLFELLQLCQRLHQETEGAFDITSGPLSRTWGFLQRKGRLPDPDAVKAALAMTDAKQVTLDPATQTIHFLVRGFEINFNSIGKGYALDQAAILLDEAGHKDFFWHGGGSSVLARGTNRSSRDDCWTVGLRDPLHREQRLVEFHLRDRALATAGGASQFFEYEGRRFSHILDPRTGWPASGVLSATVLAPTAAIADGLATAFFVMGTEAVEQYCTEHPEIATVLVCPVADQKDCTVHAFGMHSRDWSKIGKFKG